MGGVGLQDHPHVTHPRRDCSYLSLSPPAATPWTTCAWRTSFKPTGTAPTPEQTQMLTSWTELGILSTIFDPNPEDSWAHMRG